MESITVNVPDISCGHCVATVEKAAGKVAGVRSVSANADSRDVTVTYDASQTCSRRLRQHLRMRDLPRGSSANSGQLSPQATSWLLPMISRPALVPSQSFMRTRYAS